MEGINSELSCHISFRKCESQRLKTDISREVFGATAGEMMVAKQLEK
jgi:hypothetical protein